MCSLKRRLKRQELLLVVILICLVSLFVYNYGSFDYTQKFNIFRGNLLKEHEIQVEKFNKGRKDWVTSNLGSILFKFENISNYGGPRREKNFTVLIWKHWGWLKNRHIYNGDAMGDCSVQNCEFSGDATLFDTADAVLIHLQKGDVPVVKQRQLTQRWVFLNDESPLHAFTLSDKKVNWREFANVFNWSMTYRSDSDVPVPYGRTVPFSEPRVSPHFMFSDQIADFIPNWNRKRYDVLATILISNCSVKKRMDFIQKLSKHIEIDVYGGCANTKENKNKCPGHFRGDCDPISDYLFYLVLENSMCTQYVTEKIFYHAYMRGAIPVIMGISKTDCETLLPPNSYIYFDNTKTIEELAQEMLTISQNPSMVYSYHVWRNNFKVLNEHGYFKTRSYHFCRLCEALNYNDDSPKVYDEDALARYFDPKSLCSK